MKTGELQAEELGEALELRAGIFGRIGVDQWRAMRCTGVVARAEREDFPEADIAGKIVGFIPLQFRDHILRPGLTAPVVFENAVGVHESYRSKGVGTRMIDEAAVFIADRADALFVIRSGETTPGYRFYRKSGHSDLCFQSGFSTSKLNVVDDSKAASGNIDVGEISVDEWIEIQDSLNALYSRNHSAYGGGIIRSSGYWRELLDAHVFKSRPWRFFLARDKTGTSVGYMIIVLGTWRDMKDNHVYEIIATNDTVYSALLSAALDETREGSLIIPSVDLENPVRSVLSSRGFEDSASTPHIMARIVNPARLFSRLLSDTEDCEPIKSHIRIRCSTPHREIELHNPKSAERTAELEMKEQTLAHLLCCRLDVISALRTEAIRWRNRDDELTECFSRICRPAPWVQWYTDYV